LRRPSANKIPRRIIKEKPISNAQYPSIYETMKTSCRGICQDQKLKFV